MLHAQATGLDLNISPATPGDPTLHHHNEYSEANYDVFCPDDRVVWVNSNRGVYHLEGQRWFSRTKSGHHECKKTAKAEDGRWTRNGQ